MADYTADFEAGVNGNTITTGAGEASLTAWNAINGTPSYDSAHAAHGALAAKIDTNGEYMRWIQTFSNDSYGRVYLYATALPSSSQGIVKFGATGGDGGRIEIHDDGKVYTRDNAIGAVAGTVQIATNQWIRLEYHFVVSTTVGLIEVKLFNVADSTSVTDTISPTANRDTLSDLIEMYWGAPDFGPWGSDFWLDDIVANATSYPGPVQASPLPILIPSPVRW